jgi:hypothetical protein
MVEPSFSKERATVELAARKMFSTVTKTQMKSNAVVRSFILASEDP